MIKRVITPYNEFDGRHDIWVGSKFDDREVGSIEFYNPIIHINDIDGNAIAKIIAQPGTILFYD